MNDMVCLRIWQWVVLYIAVEIICQFIGQLYRAFAKAWRSQ